MEKKLSKKPLVITLTAAFIGMLCASPLALADESSSMAVEEPAPATEPATDAEAEAATPEGAATEETEAEEAEAAPAEGEAATP